MIKAFLSLSVLSMALLLSVLFWANHWWTESAVQLRAPLQMEIKEGSSIQSVSHDLHKQGLITVSPKLFQWGWRLTMAKSTLKAGDYKFEGTLPPAKIAQILSTGQIVTLAVTIPEGWNMYQIAERLENAFPKTTKAKWLQLMTDPKFREQVPGNPAHLEGFLFPETYSFSPKSSPVEVISTMVQTFKKNFTQEIIAKGNGLKLSPLGIVTLASIIEKETGKAEERPHISSVFHNRLRIGMRLQTDPTVIYGIWDRYDGNIRKSDLREPTPYNTYVISGLPPGPIASPGLASLKAAVEPKQTEDLYFVSRGDGSHVFSSNLRDHERGVYQYQIQPARNRAVRN